MLQGVIPHSEKIGAGGNKPKDDLTSYKLAHVDDIVLNSMNVIVGSVGLSKYFGIVSPVYYVLFPRRPKETNIKFYSYIFQSKSFQKNLGKLGTGILIKKSESSGKLNTIRMKIAIEDLNDEILPIPPLPEQQAIADFLDKKSTQIEKTIANCQQQIALLKEQRQIAIHQAVTKGLNPDAAMQDTGIAWLGTIPQHWRMIKLGYLGSFQNGVSKGEDYFGKGYPFVNYGNIYNNFILPEKTKLLANSTEEDRINYSVKRGDVFFTRTSETVNEIGISSTCFKTIENAVFSGFTIRFRPTKSDLLHIAFSKYFFRSNYVRTSFSKEINIVIRASLSQVVLKSLLVLLPPLSEQQAIAAHLDQLTAKIDQAIELKQQQIDKLKEYKTSLINQVVTGKIKID